MTTQYPPLFEQSCDRCRFGGKETSSMTTCKRNAPLPVRLDQEVMARWPLVMLNDWCGEWAPREEGQ